MAIKPVNIIIQVNDEMLNYLHADVDFTRSYLIDNGVDIENERSWFEKELKKLKVLAKAKEKQLIDSALLTKALERLKKMQLKIQDYKGQALQEMLIRSRIGLQFRNLDKWTDEEMREALKDVDLIKLLEELEKDK
jgi:hypothetical protein